MCTASRSSELAAQECVVTVVVGTRGRMVARATAEVKTEGWQILKRLLPEESFAGGGEIGV
jgi:hypothetical protein